MSYRSFKRLLGETSLERKCRLILGGGMFVLVFASFVFYEYQTEKLVWDQTRLRAQLLVNRILLKRHWPQQEVIDPLAAVGLVPSTFPVSQESEIVPEDIEYTPRILRLPVEGKQLPLEFAHRNEWERAWLQRLRNEPLTETWRTDRGQQIFQYMTAVRAQSRCLQCHPTTLDQNVGYQELKDGDLIAVVSVEVPLEDAELAVNVNRAILLSFAIGTAILAMIFMYATIRYVIVKPVAHLKDVSDEIASGNLAVRSNIQTGDEFQELSHAFNRMLRSLVSMQDELRKVNIDLDGKLDELARANMALFEMNRMKSDFLATISHELRTPLNSILGFSDLLAEMEDLDPRQKKWVTNIQSSGRLLLGLINDILDLAKIEAGKMQVNVEEFSLRDLVEGLIQMTRPMSDKKNIALTGEVDPSIPILRQDPHKLQQILTNLLSNAIKFTPEGGQIRVTCQPDRAHVVISVIDNGVGIAPEDQKIIFEKFRQAESSLTRHHGGTGLGLSIVREMTKLLGGDEVHLESELGRGSTFSIRIPMHYTGQPSMGLTLGDEVLDFNRARQAEVRYYLSKERGGRTEVESERV